MSRLVIVSNRVADLDKQAQSGGLAVALGDALRSVGGVWFGWDGVITGTQPSFEANLNVQSNVTVATVQMSREDYEQYYLGFSNKVLWPACHYRLDLVEFQQSYYEGYKRVNHGFATALQPLLRPNDLIWVHDYHLLALAKELRALRVTQRIGFFLHIPFPPPEMFEAVPQHDWLVEALFDFDVIGFQTTTDLNNFRRLVLDYLGGP